VPEIRKNPGHFRVCTWSADTAVRSRCLASSPTARKPFITNSEQKNILVAPPRKLQYRGPHLSRLSGSAAAAFPLGVAAQGCGVNAKRVGVGRVLVRCWNSELLAGRPPNPFDRVRAAPSPAAFDVEFEVTFHLPLPRQWLLRSGHSCPLPLKLKWPCSNHQAGAPRLAFRDVGR